MNTSSQPVKNGDLLIAEPYMGDTNFDRSVVLICEHNAVGTFGLVLNQLTDIHLSDVIEDIHSDLPLFVGGPVQQNTLHFIHRRPDLIDGSIQVVDDLYWSGDFDQIKQAVNLGTLTERDIRFFIGYSGWDEGQLDSELVQKAWIISRTKADFLFDTPTTEFWREVLKRKGGEYKSIAHYPSTLGSISPLTHPPGKDQQRFINFFHQFYNGPSFRAVRHISLNSLLKVNHLSTVPHVYISLTTSFSFNYLSLLIRAQSDNQLAAILA